MDFFGHQKRFLAQNPDKRLLVWETGTGKTRTAIEWGGASAKYTYDTLVICPKALLKNWNREIIRWGGINRWRIVSKEEFRRDWDKIQGFGQIIVDEAHYFSGINSQMSKSLDKYIKKHSVPRVLGLTATPYLSSPWNIYVLGKLFGAKGHEWSYPYFSQKYFNMIKMGPRMVPIIKKGIEKDMAQKVAEIADIVKLADCIDVPPAVFETEYLTLSPSQEKEIKALNETNFISRWTKTHQLCGGGLKGDEYNPEVIIRDCPKRERLLSLLDGMRKAIVVCRYNHEIGQIKDEIGARPVFVINGEVQDKQSVLDAANAASDCVLIVNAACSEGWQAPTFDTMIWYSYDFSLKSYIQMRGRIQRIDAIHKCTYISLVIENTVDEAVYQAVVEKKQDFHIEIYNGGNI